MTKVEQLTQQLNASNAEILRLKKCAADGGRADLMGKALENALQREGVSLTECGRLRTELAKLSGRIRELETALGRITHAVHRNEADDEVAAAAEAVLVKGIP